MIKTSIKALIAGAIFYWLITSGRLDFTLIIKALNNPKTLMIAVVLTVIQITSTAIRFGFLIKTKSTNITLKQLISIQWIAQLFSTVIPGGFTSDLVKINYIKELDGKLSRSFILFIILFDRLIGLSSLLFISGVTSLFFFKELISLNPMMEKVIVINIVLFFLTIIGMLFIFINEKNYLLILEFIPFKRIRGFLQEVWSLNQYKKIIFIAYLVNIGTHLLGIFSFWILNLPFFQGPISFRDLATLIPLGQLATIIPISPGGIGVGHVAFSTLFGFIHQTNGASLFNVYWIMLIGINCFGVIPFLLKKNKREDYGS